MLHKFQMKTNRVFADEEEIIRCLENEFHFCTLYREHQEKDLHEGDILYQGELTTVDEDTMVHRVYRLKVVAIYIGSPFNDYEYRYILEFL